MGARQSGRGAGCHYQTFSVAGPTAVKKEPRIKLSLIHLFIIMTK